MNTQQLAAKIAALKTNSKAPANLARDLKIRGVSIPKSAR